MLRVRNYRRYFLGQLRSNTGTWMQLVAQNWLILTLTGSTLAVGITVLAQSLPLLLIALPSGALADRLPKRTLLMGTQTLLALLAAALAALTLGGGTRVWQIDTLALLTGLVTAVHTPGRQAFLAELVHPGQVKAAAGLATARRTWSPCATSRSTPSETTATPASPPASTTSPTSLSPARSTSSTSRDQPRRKITRTLNQPCGCGGCRHGSGARSYRTRCERSAFSSAVAGFAAGNSALSLIL